MRTRLVTAVFIAMLSLPTLAYDHFYRGPAVTTTLSDIYVQMVDGAKVPFGEVFPDYSPRGGFGADLPRGRSDFDIGLVSDQAYQDLFRQYDANGNDYFERPEMVVMYVIQAARGLGHAAESVGTNPQALALDVPRDDTRGLLAYIQKNRTHMSVAARKLFAELPRIVAEISSAESGGPLDL